VDGCFLTLRLFSLRNKRRKRVKISRRRIHEASRLARHLQNLRREFSTFLFSGEQTDLDVRCYIHSPTAFIHLYKILCPARRPLSFTYLYFRLRLPCVPNATQDSRTLNFIYSFISFLILTSTEWRTVVYPLSETKFEI
jgi:hypothetical protein